MPQTFPALVVPGCFVRPRRWRVALLAGLALSLGLASRVPAATTWTVCASGCNYTSIKAAIAASTTLNGDMLAIAAGTYTEAGITVNKSLTLQGAGAASTIVQAAATPGTASDRVFTIASGVTVTIQGLTIRYGSAVSTDSGIPPGFDGAGGGLLNEGTLTLSNSTISGNSAYGGGGLYNDFDGTLTLSTSTISGNAASNGGGLINIGTLTLTTSTVSGNAASYSNGGGLLNEGPLTLSNSTISGNSAPYGGGLLNNDTGMLTLINSTVSGNSAYYSGGGLYHGGTLTLTNSIVANNAHGDCNGPTGSITSHGYNLDSDGSCSLTAPTDRSGVDPGLDAFTDNGTPGNGHLPLLPDSAAIDAGNDAACPPTDQLGEPRVGPCDIGAIEFQPAVLTVVIDIKPGSDPAPINPKSNGKIPVAILTTDTFDAATVDPTTVRFGRSGTEAASVQSALEDVDGDGTLDMLLHFNTQDMGIQCGDISAILTANTSDGQAIQGSDSIRTVGCH